MNAKANSIVSRVCWIAMAIIAIGLIFGPILCFAQVLGRPASESYVTSKINAHASTNNAHADIRAQVFAATTNVNALTIAATNATEAAHAATVQANAAILKNTQQDADISYLYASNANTMAIANLANTRAQAANVTNAQNGAAITSVSNLTATAQATANAAVGGVTAVSNLVIGVKALNENAITNETDSLSLSIIATNRTTIVYNPTNELEWTDGGGQVFRVTASSNWVCNIPSAPPAFTVPGLAFPFVGVFSYASGDYTLTVTEGSDVYDFNLVSDLGDYYEVLDVDVTGSETESPPMTDIELLSTHELPNAHLVLTGQTVTQQVDTVALVSQVPGIVYSNAVSQMVVWTNATGAVTNMAVCEGGTWKTNAFGAGEALPDGIVTNGQYNVTLGEITISGSTVSRRNEADYWAPIIMPSLSLLNGQGGLWAGSIRIDNCITDQSWGNTKIEWDYRYGLIFYTSPNLGESVERMRIDLFGNVGVTNNLTVSGTNTAAVVRSQSSYLLPHLGTNTTISLIFTNNTLQAWEIAP